MRSFAWLVALAAAAAAIYAWQERSGPPPNRERPIAPRGSARTAIANPMSLAAPAREVAPSRQEETPPPAAGERVVVELIEPPAETYGAQQPDEASVVYSRIIAMLGAGRADLARRGVVYDPALGRAAREVAYQHSFFAGTLPREILEFLLRAAGSTHRTVLEAYTATNAKGEEALRKRAESLLRDDTLAGPGRLHVGVGEAYVPGAAMPRFMALLAARKEIDLEPVGRRATRGGSIALRGRLPAGYERPSALALFPDGSMRSIPVVAARGDDRFATLIPVGDAPGVLEVSISATGPFGPKPLVQLPFMVDVPVPRRWAGRLAPDEGHVTTPEAATDLLLRLVNQLRQGRGLRALARDESLDRVARDHSEDMRARGFFGHTSPATGDVGDRLRAARYRATAYAENLARAATVHEAHAGLYASLGHRKNLLDSKVTRVGLGAVRTEPPEGTSPDWLLTQVFAKPIAKGE